MTNSNISTQPLRGFRDFLPQEVQKRQWLINKIRKVFEKWGYEPLETPTLEPLEIFEGQIGEEEKLFFKFEDAGRRKVALRYDQTVPACRVMGEYKGKISLPFKRYQIQPAFRAEKPQKGRYREFLQCDADIFGVKSPLADAEVIALSLDIYREIGFKKAKVLVNNRELLKGIPYEAIVAIDKLGKIGEKGVIEYMGSKGITKEKAESYLSFVKNLKPDETIEMIFDYLAGCGFDKSWYQFDPTIARSFAYSTGSIWEVVIPGFKAGSVLGGERYDNLTRDISGYDLPATGFGLGFDRTLEAAEEFGLLPDIRTSTIVLVTVFSSELLLASLAIAGKLRDKGVNTDIYPDPNDKLDKQLKYADRKNIPYAIIIGPDEAKEGKFVVKNMATGAQEKVKEWVPKM
ncbi:histidine--tRNA ligase [candidate division WWE3 bacterium RIFCSPLOWO2_01_FULL_39_13]|uniref:Histidine--tRNA ligase n=1 Tax=candidate division WWE3 bacterium RIFCSPLOWO2_01_FULL_39_13 TaxID=1802624 RepID=A0A1F4V1W8_UNCKA|nr:MAG: histidine--tRNA ligase [candidate division WWE3 bacterium RIFCSPLOWO2_01_FULL_39_13]